MADVAATAETAALLRPLPYRPSRLRSNLGLTRELAFAAFKLRYSGSVLGYLWSLVKPLLLFGMLYVIFALFLLRGRTTAGDNFTVDLLVGIVLWTFFADATASSLHAIAENGEMIRKAFFPRWIPIVASVVSAAMTLGLNLLIIVVLGIAFSWFAIGIQTMWILVLIGELFALSLGLGFLLGALYVSYRDVTHVWDVLLQLGFYASAIIFPLTLIPAAYQWLLLLNPIAQLIEDTRRALASPALPWSVQLLGWKLLVPAALVAVSVGVGSLAFHRMSLRFGERL